jgi:hypothetical protein
MAGDSNILLVLVVLPVINFVSYTAQIAISQNELGEPVWVRPVFDEFETCSAPAD